MSEVDRLEREAEAARARLVANLSRLNSNDQLSQVRTRVTADVMDAKDELISSARGMAQDRVDDVIEGVRARIAANPGAVLAIGAGLAWRLYRHPPVATILVGAGLVALMRTDPQHPAPGADLAARAAGLAEDAYDRAERWRATDPVGRAKAYAQDTRDELVDHARDARDQVVDTARSVRDKVVGASEDAREALDDAKVTAANRLSVVAGDVTEAGIIASDAAGAWRDDATEAGQDALDDAAEWGDRTRSRAARRLRQAGRTADRWAYEGRRLYADGRRMASDALPERARDRYLLGAAALALVAAVGVAAQRRGDDDEELAPFRQPHRPYGPGPAERAGMRRKLPPVEEEEV